MPSYTMTHTHTHTHTYTHTHTHHHHHHTVQVVSAPIYLCTLVNEPVGIDKTPSVEVVGDEHH